MGERCPVSKMSKQFTGDGQPQRGAEGGWGQSISPGPVGRHLAVPDEMACEEQAHMLHAFHEAGRTLCPLVASCSNTTTQHLGSRRHSKVPSSSECNRAEVLSPRRIMEPLMKGAWGGSSRSVSPGPGTQSAARAGMSSGLSLASPQGLQGGRWMSTSLPPGTEEKLEQATCCCPSPWTAGTKGQSS